MLTIFALPKPFQGHINIIQRNSIGSWVRLFPECEIILFGDEEGTSSVAEEFNIRHVPRIAKNEFGTPLVNDLFKKAQESASHELMCYLNSDVILFNDFLKATQRVHQWKERFLIVGQIINLSLEELLVFEQSNWDILLHDKLRLHGEVRESWATDYFVFPRGFYKQIPPFALGRGFFDNWLIWKALAQKAPVVNISHSVKIIHQLHDYSHVAGGQKYAHHGEEAIHNVNLAGGLSHRYCILDATHYLSHIGLKRNLINKFNLRMFKIWKARIWYSLLDITRPIRHRFDLRYARVNKFESLFIWRKRSDRNFEDK